MTIWKVLDYGSTVYADEDNNLIVVWNGSLTFNLFRELRDGVFDNFDCWTASDGFESLDAAKEYAEDRAVKSIAEESEDL